MMSVVAACGVVRCASRCAFVLSPSLHLLFMSMFHISIFYIFALFASWAVGPRGRGVCRHAVQKHDKNKQTNKQSTKRTKLTGTVDSKSASRRAQRRRRTHTSHVTRVNLLQRQCQWCLCRRAAPCAKWHLKSSKCHFKWQVASVAGVRCPPLLRPRSQLLHHRR
jgi:hypothetical protein